MKKYVVFLLVLAFVFAMVGCGQSGNADATAPANAGTSQTDSAAPAGDAADNTASTEPADSANADGKLMVGACVMDMKNEYFVKTVEGYEAFCNLTGGQVELTVVDGASSPEKQVEALENFINIGVDGHDGAERILAMGGQGHRASGCGGHKQY